VVNVVLDQNILPHVLEHLTHVLHVSMPQAAPAAVTGRNSNHEDSWKNKM
jgi:hypothetical protein